MGPVTLVNDLEIKNKCVLKVDTKLETKKLVRQIKVIHVQHGETKVTSELLPRHPSSLISFLMLVATETLFG